MNTYKRSPILRGDILYAELGAAVGSEQAGFRPVVVVQNDVCNRYSPTVVVKCRLGDKLGHVSKSVMHQIDAAAAISLGLRSLQKDKV